MITAAAPVQRQQQLLPQVLGKTRKRRASVREVLPEAAVGGAGRTDGRRVLTSGVVTPMKTHFPPRRERQREQLQPQQAQVSIRILYTPCPPVGMLHSCLISIRIPVYTLPSRQNAPFQLGQYTYSCKPCPPVRMLHSSLVSIRIPMYTLRPTTQEQQMQHQQQDRVSYKLLLLRRRRRW